MPSTRWFVILPFCLFLSRKEKDSNECRRKKAHHTKRVVQRRLADTLASISRLDVRPCGGESTTKC